MNKPAGFKTGTIIRVLSILLGIGLAACSSPAVVIISSRYDPQHIRRVAILRLADYPGSPGSGEIVAGAFEKYLLLPGYSLIERRQVSQILQEQSFDVSGAVDQATIRSLGKILGVDALVLGSVTDFVNTREHTVMVDMPQEQSSPIYGRVVTVQHNGDTTVKNVQDVVTGYSVTRTDQVVPETQTLPARVGMSVRLVDVETGEVLWSAAGSSDGYDLTSTAEDVSSKIMQAVVKRFKTAAKTPS